MAKYLVQIVVTGVQVVGRAFGKALRQEFQASQQAAQRSSNRREGSKRAAADSLSGISLQEAKQILNITENQMESEEVSTNYEHLFNVNDKSKGGSLYIQSKVVRAKERLDIELKNIPDGNTEEPPKS